MLNVAQILEATRGRLIQGRKNIALSGISIDSRRIKTGEAFVAIKGNNFDGHDFIGEALKKGAKTVIIQHPVFLRFAQDTSPKDTERRRSANIQYPKGASFILVKDTIKALGDIARFKRKKFDIPVIAITGSNGKTTAKEMIAWILSQRFSVLKNEGTKNNQIGLPLTLLNLNSRYDIAVLELGANHFGEIEYLAKICQPNIGMITNIGPAHLENLRNLKFVFKEKYTLIKNLKVPYIAVLNSDDNLLRKQVIKKTEMPFIFGFGIRYRSDFFASDIKVFNHKTEFRVNQKYKFTLRTPGYYNIYNALAAISLARIFGIGYKDIAARLSTFDFPQGRLKVIELNKIKFIDDTYNSNPVSLRQAIDTLHKFKTKGRKIFCMGDMLELGRCARQFHRQAGRQVASVCDVFITVGELSNLAAQAAKSCGFALKNIFTCESSQEAGNILFNKIVPKQNDIVLVKGSRLMQMEEIFKAYAILSTLPPT